MEHPKPLIKAPAWMPHANFVIPLMRQPNAPFWLDYFFAEVDDDLAERLAVLPLQTWRSVMEQVRQSLGGCVIRRHDSAKTTMAQAPESRSGTNQAKTGEHDIRASKSAELGNDAERSTSDAMRAALRRGQRRSSGEGDVINDLVGLLISRRVSYYRAMGSLLQAEILLKSGAIGDLEEREEANEGGTNEGGR